MVNKVTESDLREYIEDNYGISTIPNPEDPNAHVPEDILFEAFSERAITQNPNYQIRKLADRWENEYKDTSISKYEFTVQVFNELISEEVYTKLTHREKDTWIQATVQGISELTTSNEELSD